MRKCQVRIASSLIYFWGILCGSSLFADETPSVSPIPVDHVVWAQSMGGFSDADYDSAVKNLLKAYEDASNKPIKPGERARVGLKIYTNSGPGLATPLPLVRALINELEARGYERENLFIIDKKSARLRRCGFTPPLSKGGSKFEGVPVYALDEGAYWDQDWFYNSSLPSREKITRLSFSAVDGKYSDSRDRKSLLPMPLMFDVDFWINLPMVMSHKAIGVSGAMANGTLWNVSNSTRFWDNPYHAAVAIAEIAAIPELRERWTLNIMTLQRYQVIGGYQFNAYYTDSEPTLWLSTNGVAMDYAMIGRINKNRKKHKLPLLESEPQFFEYCKQLNLGDFDKSVIEWRKL